MLMCQTGSVLSCLQMALICNPGAQHRSAECLAEQLTWCGPCHRVSALHASQCIAANGHHVGACMYLLAKLDVPSPDHLPHPDADSS